MENKLKFLDCSSDVLSLWDRDKLDLFLTLCCDEIIVIIYLFLYDKCFSEGP